jgi:hypothetical protein
VADACADYLAWYREHRKVEATWRAGRARAARALGRADELAQRLPRARARHPARQLNKEVKRRADVVGIFPGEASITRLIGAVLLEHNDEWQTDRRYMQLEGMAELAASADEAEPPLIPPKAA